ncbi:MAG: sigma-70 family RNA polymerase sigma factor [Acidobacteria bacterium]|nr:MAG: sigma-70 family RNA polymerase sigma factor [Acidobacteriota bacterium]
MASSGSSGSDDPDRDLLARVAAGDHRAFAELMRRHESRVIGLCSRLLDDREAARDAAQEVFLKVYRKAAGFRPRGKVYTWLYRIAVNHCLNRLRRRRIVRFLPLGEIKDPAAEEPAFEPVDEGPDPARRLAARRRWQATRARIAALPPGQRAVLVLARFEGLRYRQIAQVLGISEGAVESRLFRAMRTLERAQEVEG